MQKFDPYINIDPGTMNPIQHGEVFVTDDSAETDLDLGHYERFIDESLSKNSNVTTGKSILVCTSERTAATILAEELFRSFLISQMRLRAVFTAILPLKIHILRSSRSVVRLEILKVSLS